ncbi:TPA: hypothetical protein ACGN8S_001079 [Bacillus cereus]|uniref:hypothetical protein n=1 Tax=Bacillus sp. N35-10-4 TaxID=1866315 RepID=UPI000B1FC228
MKLTKEERKELTYQIGDIIEQKCKRCYCNRTSNECLSVNECKVCPIDEELCQLGRYFDTQPKKNGGPRREVPSGLTPEAVRNLNIQDMPVAPRISGKRKSNGKERVFGKGQLI